jgi:AraC-like DNA-binding protein
MSALFRDRWDAPHGYRGGRPRPAPEPTQRERQIVLAMLAPLSHLEGHMRGPRSELAIAGQDGGSVASVANAHGFGSLSRFAVDYKARFHESPSETLRRGTVGRGAIG